MRTETPPKSTNSFKEETSPKLLLGAGIAAVVVVVGLLIYFLRASDPATRPPIPYQKFDYGQHMQQTQPRSAMPASGSSQPTPPANP